MASALDKLFAGTEGTAAASRDLKVVVSYKADLAKDSKGNYGFSIRPVLADGSLGRFSDMWIRLQDGPQMLRAFKASLPAIHAAIVKVDQYMVDEGDWKPAQTTASSEKPKQPAAPKAKPAAAPEPQGDSIFDTLPF
jgi:hypothetical protein